MARFDVYRMSDGGFAIDCQGNQFDDIGTRFIVPLVPRGDGPAPNGRLNPIFDINGEPMVMTTQLATAVRTGELRTKVLNLEDQDTKITGAIDMLIGTA